MCNHAWLGRVISAAAVKDLLQYRIKKDNEDIQAVCDTMKKWSTHSKKPVNVCCTYHLALLLQKKSRMICYLLIAEVNVKQTSVRDQRPVHNNQTKRTKNLHNNEVERSMKKQCKQAKTSADKSMLAKLLIAS